MTASRPVLAVLAAAYAATAAVVIAILVGSRVGDRPSGDFVRDPVTVLDGAVYVGLVSHLGTIVWSAAATSCFLAAIVLGGRTRRAFAWAGVLTTALLVDDVFLVHETYAEETGGSERHVLALYPIALAAYVVVYRTFLRRHDAWLLVIALALFGVSAIVDVRDAEEYLLEDSAKLFGIVTWCVVFAAASVRELRRDA